MARFLAVTDFGYNFFNPEKRVLDVIVFEDSAQLQETLSLGLSKDKKAERSRADLKSLPK